MEPATAAGLAVTVLGFVDLGFKIFNKAAEIYRSPHGCSSGSNAAKYLAEEVIKSMDLIRAEQKLEAAQNSTGCERYDDLVNECSSIADEILLGLEKISVGKGLSRCASFKKAITSFRSEKHVEVLLERLERIKNEVTLRLSYNTYKNIKALGISVAQIASEVAGLRSERPKELGYTWETGTPKDHLWVDDGLDPPFLLPLSLCSSVQSLFGVLKVKYRDKRLPGSSQVFNGHIMIWNWEETESLPTSDENWLPTLESWRRVKLAFAMSTPLGGFRNRTVKKCIRCRKPSLSRKTGKFATCTSCKLAFRSIDPTVFPVELQDLTITYHNHAYRNYILASRVERKQPSSSSDMGAAECLPLTDSSREMQCNDGPAIEFVCRRIVVKWEPMFNVVHRYLYCRCILRKTSPASCEEEMTLLITARCPRHNSDGISFPDYGNDDYHLDPYFERFCGYSMFCFMVLICRPDLYQLLGGDDFMSEHEFGRERVRYDKLLDKEKFALHETLNEYWLEVYEELDKRNVPLPPQAAETLRVKRAQEDDRRPNLSLGNLSNLPMLREVRDICAGKWDGKFHWAEDD